MKKCILILLILNSYIFCLNIDSLNDSYYLGQIDKFENFKICFDSKQFSGFFVINISNDIKFLKDKNCVYIYSLKNSNYGKKFLKVSFVKCFDPFDFDLCNAFNEKSKKLIFYFDLNKSYIINIRYNKTGIIYENQTVVINVSGRSLGNSYFNIKNIVISPKKYDYYNVIKDKNVFKIVFMPVLEDKYNVSFDIIRNNFEKKHVSINISIKPTLIGKIKNIKRGTLLIPSYLQGFYSLISLFLSN